MWVENILSPHSSWGDGGTPNHKCPLYRPINVTALWSGAVPVCPDYMPMWSPENARAAAREFRDDFRRASRCDLDFRRSISFNPVTNPRVKRRVDEREGPVDQ